MRVKHLHVLVRSEIVVEVSDANWIELSKLTDTFTDNGEEGSIHAVQSCVAHAETTNLFARYADSLSCTMVAVAHIPIHPLRLQTGLWSKTFSPHSSRNRVQRHAEILNCTYMCFTHELVWACLIPRASKEDRLELNADSWSLSPKLGEKKGGEGTKMGAVAGEYTRILMVCTFNLKEIWVANNWPNASRPDTRTESSEKRPWGEKLLGSLRQDPTLLWKAVRWCWQQKCCPCWS